ncbi:bifunctional hydroxymethylpyrimidine kinase/phosphomethylpyrimidine kinase [Paenibacillus aurantius]|uniref:Hydroxymethylpyrimidine/phosphomethylpyrimidine kinase n=1 Tax=Paenibacillus aurantius TaxID=2918900 RepID=A0AA96LDT2_9BACL|nr:bifunctional hydroxymethylpyrimidine kinase/phosphomethylpyrimidine kinase [Paenibacillus aurantius]WNQ09827.1 bifunctional hydroxymethylpyrimidine kinase/phosphomethylpyrimidine kinase [Paenibacillus aurantius]
MEESTVKTIPRALTIAGSDSGGGAGIQADLKTFQMLDVFGMSALTAVTAQNTLGVHGIYEIPLEGIAAQIDAVVEDLGVDAVKTGMLSRPDIIELVADRIRHHKLTALVIDPVMIAKGGAALLKDEAKSVLRDVLVPLAAVVTPNVPEAEVLTGMTIATVADMEEAARRIVDGFGARAAVVKGGHLEGEPTDVLYDGTSLRRFTSERYATRHTHGTGCTFSAAITAELAKGRDLPDAVQTAKAFITSAIKEELGLGAGHGPTNHWAYGRTHTRGK